MVVTLCDQCLLSKQGDALAPKQSHTQNPRVEGHILMKTEALKAVRARATTFPPKFYLCFRCCLNNCPICSSKLSAKPAFSSDNSSCFSSCQAFLRNPPHLRFLD